MGVKFTGVNELRIALKKKMNMDDVKRVVRKNGADMQTKAQRNAPVDTGTLKRSIGLELSDSGLTAKVEPTAEYAPYVNYGTRYQEAQPFLTDAFNEQKETFKIDLKNLTK